MMWNYGWWCERRRPRASRRLGPLRVERVLHAVADQVERQHGEQQRHAREEQEPPGDVEDRRRLREHLAPRWLRGLDTHAEEGERRLEQDVRRDEQRGVDDDRGHEVGEDLAEHDPPVRGPEGPRSLDELLLTE